MDSLSITIIFIALSGIIGAFIKGRLRDKCLLSFEADMVNVETKDGKTIWGQLHLESTGFELEYKQPYLDREGNTVKRSFIFYKNEYPTIRCIVRYVKDLNDKQRKKRHRLLERLRNRKTIGFLRKIRNFFATVRDSVVELINLLIGQAKRFTPIQRVVSGQDRYVSQIQTETLSVLNTSFEPLLEKHIGRRVILDLSSNNEICEYIGILKGYTLDFLELMDLDYNKSDQGKIQKADIIVPRSIGIIRHLGE